METPRQEPARPGLGSWAGRSGEKQGQPHRGSERCTLASGRGPPTWLPTGSLCLSRRPGPSDPSAHRAQRTPGSPPASDSGRPTPGISSQASHPEPLTALPALFSSPMQGKPSSHPEPQASFQLRLTPQPHTQRSAGPVHLRLTRPLQPSPVITHASLQPAQGNSLSGSHFGPHPPPFSTGRQSSPHAPRPGHLPSPKPGRPVTRTGSKSTTAAGTVLPAPAPAVHLQSPLPLPTPDVSPPRVTTGCCLPPHGLLRGLARPPPSQRPSPEPPGPYLPPQHPPQATLTQLSISLLSVPALG